MSTELPIIIGHNITILRKIKKVKVRDIANYLDISVQQIYKYESGASVLSAVDLVKIADFFKVNIIALITPIVFDIFD